MTSKGPAGRKLAEAVADHIFGDENFNKNMAVMDLKILANEIGTNLAIPSPGFDSRPFITHTGRHLLD